jgi:G3E family GTPase
LFRFVPIGGFLGAGKTTTMLAAARQLEVAGERVSVVTNDQGVDLIDTQLARATHVDSVSEVTGGCFCCRFDDLAAVIERLNDEQHPTVVLAEAVGSCTDLQSTVVRPLRQLYGETVSVSPLVVIVDPVRYGTLSRLWSAPDSEPDMAYLYRHQLDEADVIAVNKADLLSGEEIGQMTGQIQERFPGTRVISYSASTGDGLGELIQMWTSGTLDHPGRRAFAVDYDRYGAAEAELAWTNQVFNLAASGDSFVPADWVTHFLDAFSQAIAGATVGHVKIRLTTSDGSTKASLTGSDQPSYDEQHWTPATSAAVTLNARVAMSPDELEDAIAASTAAADAACGIMAGPRTGDIFRPGFPVPVHRM